jgi:hypothetical protein
VHEKMSRKDVFIKFLKIIFRKHFDVVRMKKKIRDSYRSQLALLGLRKQKDHYRVSI